MRYTTVIDISEIPEIYRNMTARMIYLHICLKAGYHDNDRDLAVISIRRLAGEAGCSVSAVRHALKVLINAQLLIREGKAWRVKKWVEEQKITARARTKRELQEQVQVLERQKQAAINEAAYRMLTQEEHQEAMNSEAYKNIARRFGLDKKDDR